MVSEEITLAELYRGLQRIEVDLKEIKSDSVHRVELEALQADVKELQDAQKWLIRSMGGLFLGLLADLLIRLPPPG